MNVIFLSVQYLQGKKLIWFGHLERIEEFPVLVNIKHLRLFAVSIEGQLGNHEVMYMTRSKRVESP